MEYTREHTSVHGNENGSQFISCIKFITDIYSYQQHQQRKKMKKV